MGLKVKYPTGSIIYYHRAHFLSYGNNAWHLYTDKDESSWVASIQHSAGVIVEAMEPAYSIHKDDPEDCARVILAQMECVPSHLLAKLKKRLKLFDSRDGRWVEE